jgi:hypothetical protein
MVKALEAQEGAAMPAYEHYRDEGRGDVTVTFSISEHDKATGCMPAVR